MEWTEREILIVDMWNAGKTCSEIGRAVKKATIFVENKLAFMRRRGVFVEVRVKPRPPSSRNKKPAADKAHEIKKRKCLRCAKLFLSEWKGNRLCVNCKGSKDFSSVLSVY